MAPTRVVEVGAIAARRSAGLNPPSVNPATVTVQVINATGRIGLAATNAATLRELGFATVTPANGATRTTTTITYPAGHQEAAQALAAHVPGATLVAGGTGRTLTLALGTDGTQATAASSAATSAAPTAAAPTSAAKSFTASSCIN